MADLRSVDAPFALPEQPTEPDLLAKYFKVLADPTRVRILELLQERGELSVGELVRALEQSQPKVSNHLACLRWCGFVHTRREHPSVLYRVADERVLDVLALGRALLSDNAEHVALCSRVDGSNC
jgi:DNA-binding transcriptional ArsR family regulator